MSASKPSYNYHVHTSELLHPFTLMIVGSTGTGKTEWTKRMVENAKAMIHPPPDRIIWAYTEYQPAYECLEGMVDFVEGLPDFDELKRTAQTERKLLILDDLMDTLKGDARLVQLFTRGSHHWNTSVVHICQSMCYGEVQSKARSNSHYLVIMPSAANVRQVTVEASNMYPHNTHYFMWFPSRSMATYSWVARVPHRNVLLTADEKQRLKYHKDRMATLLKKRVSYKKKKQVLSQSGGFLPQLLAPVLGIASSLIGDAISGAINRK